MSDVVDVSAWVGCEMCEHGWRTKVSNIGDVARSTKVLDSIVGCALFLKVFPKAHRK